LFAERFEEPELQTIGDLLSRLGEADPRDCDPDG
jgi:hypothetical protein